MALSASDSHAILNKLRLHGFSKVQSSLIVEVVQQVVDASPSGSGGAAPASNAALVNSLIFRR